MTSVRKSIKTSRFDRKKYHCKPLRSLWNAPQRKGTTMKFRIIKPKKPNSAKRRITRISLTNGRWVTAKVKGQGNNLQVYSEVLACGGRANDLPGVRFNMIKGGEYGFNYKERFNRKYRCSKYGKTLEDRILDNLEEKEKNEEKRRKDEEAGLIKNPYTPENLEKARISYLHLSHLWSSNIEDYVHFEKKMAGLLPPRIWPERPPRVRPEKKFRRKRKRIRH